MCRECDAEVFIEGSFQGIDEDINKRGGAMRRPFPFLCNSCNLTIFKNKQLF